jgi:hypothetical protein
MELHSRPPWPIPIAHPSAAFGAAPLAALSVCDGLAQQGCAEYGPIRGLGREAPAWWWAPIVPWPYDQGWRSPRICLVHPRLEGTGVNR